ncbi:hypothetical protein [Colwellia chukchiensis]|uniref:hypothetical protein n=1 Tax=Colwellia chukchiensis TaxID=641665 RepID=UPI000A1727D2|nr:hypothetical protein [Colwellia chukchiensis]
MKPNVFFIVFVAFLVVSCTSNLKSPQEYAKHAVVEILTGKKISYGNEAKCEHYKQTCGNDYREWLHKGKIACSC